MWQRWTCRRLQGALIDLAEGTLDANRRRRVVAHLARCGECAAAASALRDLPALLRDTTAQPDEAFWQAQRAAVMREVRTLPVPASRIPGRSWRPAVPLDRRLLRWAPALAVAAAAAVVLALRPLTSLPDFRHTPPTNVESLDDPTLLSLSELAGGGSGDVEQASDVAVDAGPLPELSNEELHALAELVGVRGR
jgi:hypothetical protein